MPLSGTSGGMVSGRVWITGSGSAAIATRLTALTATAPPVTPAYLKKSRLDVMERVFPSVDQHRPHLGALAFTDRVVLVGRPISEACSAASANQNCCSASMAAITVLTWSRESASNSNTPMSIPL